MPNREVVRKALSAIKRTVDYQYFFDHLTSPEWVEPLRDEGMFREPPAAEREGEYIRFPTWPESRYLARMASLAPEPILEIILAMPPTDNVRVIEDLIDAAVSMPPELSIRLLDKAKAWAESPYQLRLPEKLGALVSGFAKGKKVSEALDLAEAVLAVFPDPRFENLADTEGELPYRPTPEPRARFEQWDYERILQGHLPDLVQEGRLQALELMTRLMTKSLEISTGYQEDPDSDYSYIWRPAIEDDRQNSHHGIKDVLVTAVRDVATRLAEQGLVQEVLQVLYAQRFQVFHRIALHVLRVIPEVPTSLIVAQLTNASLVENTAVYHEFWLLARDRLRELDADDQRVLFETIDRGPDVERVRAGMERWTGKPYSDEETDRYIKDWKLRRLTIIRDALPPERLREVESLEREMGPREHPEFVSYMGEEVQTGPNSPMEPDQLANLRVDDLVKFLRTWQPSGEWMGPSPEGLSRDIRSVISANPHKYAADATKFKELDPTYVRGLLEGFEGALKAKAKLAWPSILELCAWVVEQPREIPGREGPYADLDPGWVWTRKAIASLLANGFDPADNQIPFDLREQVWRILSPLTDDPEPSPEHEAQYGGDNMDPATLSINTTRGEAMHAIVRYALWVRRHWEQTHNNELLQRGFDAMPEVRSVLEKHLDPSQDPSLAVRAVYGQWFPWLILLDKDWSKSRVSAVFAHESTQAELRRAAWETYIVFCQPYDSSFEVLYDEYVFALEHLSSTRDSKRHPGDPNGHLAQHVMTYYWQGKLELEDENNLLGLFFANANSSLRGQTLEFIGRTFWRTPGEVLDRIIERVKVLWIARLETAQGADSLEEYRGEMAAFGWWFASGKFEEAWAIEQLESALRLVGKIEADHLIAERFASISGRFLYKAMICMRLMVESDKEEGWSILGWRDSARAAITRALSSDDSETRAAAEDLVHYLGARGHLEFRDLLEK